MLGSFLVLLSHVFYGKYDARKRERINAYNVCRRIWKYKGRIGTFPYPVKLMYGKSAIYTEVNPRKANSAKICFIAQFMLEFVAEIIDTIKGYFPIFGVAKLEIGVKTNHFSVLKTVFLCKRCIF